MHNSQKFLQVPIPSFQTLLLTFLFPNRGVKIAKFVPSNRSEKEFGILGFSKTAISLRFIVEFIRSQHQNKKIRVFIPDYFCNISLNYLRLINTELYFYETKEDGSPNFLLLKISKDPDSVNLFLLVHYFGKTHISAVLEEVINHCKKNSSYLIEDYVHRFGIAENKINGDFALISPHKFHPIPDGSICIINSSGPMNKMISWDGVKNNLFRCYDRFTSRDPSVRYDNYIWVIKRIIQKLGFAILIDKLRGSSRMDKFNAKESNIPLTLTFSSYKYLNRDEKKFYKIFRKRISIYCAWKRSLNIFIPKKYIAISKNRSAYLCQITISQKFQNFFQKFFREVSCKLQRWPDLPPEVTASIGAHDSAKIKYQKNFYLPCNQDIKIKSVERCIYILQKYLSKHYHISSLTKNEFNTIYSNLKYSSYIQSEVYGDVISKKRNAEVMYLLIKDVSLNPVGIVQIIKKKILFFNLYRINRGPLMYDIINNEYAEVGLVLVCLKNYLAKYIGRGILFLAPDFQFSDLLFNLLSVIGFNYIRRSSWESAFVDIDLEEDAILKKMSGRWRNSLKKAINSNVKIEKLYKHNSISEFIGLYESIKKQKGFDGISSVALIELFNRSSSNFGVEIFTAYDNSYLSRSEIIGGVAFIYANGVATYLVGASNDEGRKRNVNTVLLWRVIQRAKELGCVKFDLGGLGIKTPKGIANFKSSLNPLRYKLIGEFWAWI